MGESTSEKAWECQSRSLLQEAGEGRTVKREVVDSVSIHREQVLITGQKTVLSWRFGTHHDLALGCDTFFILIVGFSSLLLRCILFIAVLLF